MKEKKAMFRQEKQDVNLKTGTMKKSVKAVKEDAQNEKKEGSK